MTQKLTKKAQRVTIEDLYRGFHMKQPEQSSIYVYTGIDGMEKIAYEMDKNNLLDQVNFIAEKKFITEDEQSRLKEMINSSDKESYELAKMVVAEKQRPMYERHYHKMKTLIGKKWL